MGCLTLITDFGTDDAYVGAMKGAMLTVDPTARIVDISHGVPPQDVFKAGRLLKSVVPYYPAGTVHAVVVDPGVGSRRRILAAAVADGYVVVPDNGCLEFLTTDFFPSRVVSIENRSYYNPVVSNTFHGRDIIGPVAAHIGRGVDLGELGSIVDPEEIVHLQLPAVEHREGALKGEIVDVDHFGNLITNIHRDHLGQLASPNKWPQLHTTIEGCSIAGMQTHYSASKADSLLALVGSDGYLEVAVNGGNAAQKLNMKVGGKVSVGTINPTTQP